MALYFDVKITGTQIGDFYARRTDGTTDPDSIGTYVVVITQVGALAPWTGTVQHRYGDGAWALISRAIAAAGLDGEA